MSRRLANKYLVSISVINIGFLDGDIAARHYLIHNCLFDVGYPPMLGKQAKTLSVVGLADLLALADCTRHPLSVIDPDRWPYLIAIGAGVAVALAVSSAGIWLVR
jgi:hypothetical protein